MAYLTDAQVWGLVAATWIGAGLSLFGSSFLACSIIKKGKHLKDTYHRLLLSLCINDLLSSTTHIVGPFLVPAETSVRTIVARGNTATCAAVGFFTQFSVNVLLYNAYMAVYFLSIIRYEITDRSMMRMEQIMHAVAIAFSLGTASWGLANDLYNELGYAGLGCWLSDLPDGCTEDPLVECQRGEHAGRHGYVVGLLPGLLCPMTVLICNLLIYLKVRKIYAKTSNKSHESSGTESNFHESNLEAGRRRTRATATQSFFYVLSFMNSVFWMIVMRILDSQAGNTVETESETFGLAVIAQLLFPMQGFTIFLVHLRPRYLRHRKRNPDLSRLRALRKAMSIRSSRKSKKKQEQKPRYIRGRLQQQGDGFGGRYPGHHGAAAPPPLGDSISLQSEGRRSTLKEDDEDEKQIPQGKFQEDEDEEMEKTKGHREAGTNSGVPPRPRSDVSVPKSLEEEFLDDDSRNNNAKSASLPNIPTTNNKQVSFKQQNMKGNEENANASLHRKSHSMPRFMSATMAAVVASPKQGGGGGSSSKRHQHPPRFFSERRSIEPQGSLWRLQAILGDESDEDESENYRSVHIEDLEGVGMASSSCLVDAALDLMIRGDIPSVDTGAAAAAAAAATTKDNDDNSHNDELGQSEG